MGSTQGSAGRGGKEPKSTGDLARSMYKSMGGGSVSPEVRAAIQKKMNQGLKPEGGPQPAVSPQSRAESRFPPRAPAVRTTKGTATPRSVAPAPMPSPKPGKVPRPTPKLAGPKAALEAAKAKAPVPLASMRAKPGEDLKAKLKNAAENMTNASDSTIRTSGTSIKRSRNMQNWRTSGLAGERGVLGGQHMGGHSDVGGAIEMGGGGLGINEFNK
jgi:hypothetical protein